MLSRLGNDEALSRFREVGALSRSLGVHDHVAIPHVPEANTLSDHVLDADGIPMALEVLDGHVLCGFLNPRQQTELYR